MFTRKGFLGLGAAAAVGGVITSTGVTHARASFRRTDRTLIRNIDVLTMNDRFEELLGVDVLVEGGRVAAIGPGLQVADAEIVEGAGKILMPGMVDGHRHVWDGIHIGLVVRTIQDTSFKYQDAKMRYMVALTEEDLYLANYFGGLMAIDSGVTSLIDYAHIHYTPERADAGAHGLIDSGVSGWYCWQTSHTPSYGPGDTVPQALADAERNAGPEAWRYDHARRMKETLFSDDDALLRFGLALSNARGGVQDYADEITRCRRAGAGLIVQHYRTPVNPPPGAYRGIVDLNEADVLGPDLHFDHAYHLTDEDLRLLRETGGSTCSTPSVEFTLPPQTHWLARRAGVSTSIGIDVPIKITADYFETTRNAYWSIFRTDEGAEYGRSLNSVDALDFATRWGARAVRLGGVTGSVEPGFRADLVMLRTDRLGFAPHGSLADRVLNFASWSDIDSVWIAGRARKRDGRMLGVDMAHLRRRQIAAQDRAAILAESITFSS